MAKAGQHQNSGVSSSKPRGHEKSQGPNHPDRSQEITTGSYKKPETYQKQAASGGNTSDQGRQRANREAWNSDIREAPDTTTGSTRARDSDVTGGRSGSDSNASRKSKGH